MSQLLVARSICEGLPHTKHLPKNFFILQNNSWSDLKQLSFQGNDVAAFEVTNDTEENCKRMFLNLAREHEGLMFYRIVFDRPEAVPTELSKDLGTIRCIPTFALAYFSVEGIVVTKFEGEAEIDAAILRGLVDDKITQLLESKADLRVAQLQSRRPHPSPHPQVNCREADGKMMEMERRVEVAERAVEELQRQKERLEEALRCAHTSVHEPTAMEEGSEGGRDQVLIQKADTTELGHGVPIPQPMESPCGAMRQEGIGEHEEEQEEEEEEEEGGGGGGGSSLALEHLPDKLRIKVTNLVESFQKEQKGKGKTSKKGSCALYDEQLLDIVLECDKTTKTSVVRYLSNMLDVTSKTLYRRTKIRQRKKQFHNLLQKLREAVMETMPEQLSRYQQVQAAREAGNSSAKHPSRKRYKWSPKTIGLLCEIVSLKLEMESRSLFTKDKLMQFFDDEILPLWPKGWMLKSQLLKHSKSVHKYESANPSLKAAATKPKVPRSSSSPVHTLTSGSTSDLPLGGSMSDPPTPTRDEEWPSNYMALTLCEPLSIHPPPLSHPQ